MLVRFSRRLVIAASVAALGLIAFAISPFAANHPARADAAQGALPVQGDPTPPPHRPLVGVVAHRLNDRDVRALRAMRVTLVRLSLYPDGDGARWIDRARAEGFDVLVVSYRTRADRRTDRTRWPGVKWQYGNEPDWSHVTPTKAAVAASLSDVSPGLGHGTPRAWMRAFTAKMAPSRAPLAVHCYGEPLSAAVASTLADARASAGRRAIWFTEIGQKADAVDLDKALHFFVGTPVARVYVYALWSESDGYTLTAAQRVVIRRFVEGY